MEKSTKYVLGIAAAMVAVVFIGTEISTANGKALSGPGLAVDNKAFKEIKHRDNSNVGIRYDNHAPDFTIFLPDNYVLKETTNQNNTVIKEAASGDNKLQVKIVDTYSAKNESSEPRERYSFNALTVSDMKPWYEKLEATFLNARKTLDSDRKNIELSIKRLNGNVLIYQKFDLANADNKVMRRLDYCFMKDGYTIDIIAYFAVKEDSSAIMKCMNSFRFK